MKISWNWLQEFVAVKKPAEQVGESLTLHTAELEDIDYLEDIYKHIFFGKLVSFRPHKEAEKLSVAEFDLGEHGKKQIIFGKVHEVFEGEIYPIALGGTTLISGIEIKEGEIRGELSQGMICDNTELGLKNEDLMRFSNNKLIGKRFSEVFKECQEAIFDIDNKSLTHRPDLMGHRGFARELAVIFGSKLVLPEPLASLPQQAPEFPVKVETQNCRRFCALKIENISVEPSPLEKQLRLEHLGTKAISNLVDITNWIMLEYGQPMHVFDADKVEGALIIRQAKEGERLLTLDGNEYELTEEDTVVADENKVLSLAGVMGGLESSVTQTTTKVIFEAANWDPVAVRKTCQRHGLRTESSMRYEKSLDPEACKKAVIAAAEYTSECCRGAQNNHRISDVYPTVFSKISITLNPEKVRSIAGCEIKDAQMEKTLSALGFGVKKSGKNFKIEVPSYRATKDISTAEDLAEEIIRIHGFENIPSSLPTLPVAPPDQNFLRQFEWKFRNFASSRDFLELYNYSFVSHTDQEFTGESDYVTIENPLSEAYQFLRKNLVSNTLKSLESELRTHGKLDFFELGKTYKPQDGVLPKEVLYGMLFSATLEGDENEMFYKLKKEFTTFLSHWGLQAEFVPTSKTQKYEHPSKTADIIIDQRFVGRISVLHPQFQVGEKSAIVFLEVDMEKCCNAWRAVEDQYTKLSPFPSVRRDISLVLPEKVLISQIERSAFGACPGLQKIELFDEYQDEKFLGKGLKNLAFHLEFQSSDHTLQEAEIETIFQAVVTALKKDLGAQLRLEFDNAK